MNRRAVLIFDPFSDDDDELPGHYRIVGMFCRGWPRLRARVIVESVRLPVVPFGTPYPRVWSVSGLLQLEANRIVNLMKML